MRISPSGGFSAQEWVADALKSRQAWVPAFAGMTGVC